MNGGGFAALYRMVKVRDAKNVETGCCRQRPTDQGREFWSSWSGLLVPSLGLPTLPPGSRLRRGIMLLRDPF
jgi:hypothetical protein